MAALLIIGVVIVVALLAGLTGADSRPGVNAPPEAQWPFYRHRS